MWVCWYRLRALLVSALSLVSSSVHALFVTFVFVFLIGIVRFMALCILFVRSLVYSFMSCPGCIGSGGSKTPLSESQLSFIEVVFH